MEFFYVLSRLLTAIIIEAVYEAIEVMTGKMVKIFIKAKTAGAMINFHNKHNHLNNVCIFSKQVYFCCFVLQYFFSTIFYSNINI